MERARPEDYQPVLTGWSHLWRFAVMVVISLAFWSLVFDDERRTAGKVELDAAIGVAAFALVLLRRQRPFLVAAVLNVVAVVSASASGPAVLAAVSLATRRQRREVVALAALIFAASTGFYYYQHMDRETRLWVVLVYNAAFATIQIGWGLYLGSRRELIWQLNRRAEAAEAERDERVARAREGERARIAREMHDVLAHRITQISMLSGAMSIREDLSAEELRGAAGAIQSQARDALTDLRGVLGVLRDPTTGAPLDQPQPTYDDLGALVDSAREAGADVVLTEELLVPGAEIPIPTGRAIYRIVQEGLTNAARHAPGARVYVDVEGGPEAGLTVLMRNRIGFGFGKGSSRQGAGLGLVGLTERAELQGGRLRHRTTGATFQLEAWLPWGP